MHTDLLEEPVSTGKPSLSDPAIVDALVRHLGHRHGHAALPDRPVGADRTAFDDNPRPGNRNRAGRSDGSLRRPWHAVTSQLNASARAAAPGPTRDPDPAGPAASAAH